MAWNSIAAADVLAEFTPVEQATLQNIQGATGNLAGILTNVVNAARGAIVAGGNQLDQAGTIPDQLREDVIAIARWKWLISFPALKNLQTDQRKEAATEAQKRIDGVSAGKPKIEIPANPIATKSPVGGVGIARTGKTVSNFDRLGSS